MHRLLLTALAAAHVLFAGLPAPAAWAAARCDGQHFAVRHVKGGHAPYISRTALGRTGAFILDYGATNSTLSRAHFPAYQGAGTLTATDFSLPGFVSGRFKLVQYWHRLSPGSDQIGVIGTDFLAHLTADFSFRPGRTDVILSPAPCDPARLKARGLVPVSQSGFFSHDRRRVARNRPNVPVLYLRFGAVVTWAQIDTGYDDVLRPPSVDINHALYTKLRSAGVRLTPMPDVHVSTCAGVERRQVYRLARLTVQSETGTAIRDVADVNLILKSPNGCGGIAGRTEPAAQVAASLLARLGEVVFDPRSEKVWIKPQP